MPVIDWNTEQGTAEWYSKRAGIPTASMFDKILTPKKQELAEGRKAYACRLLAERLLNWQADSLDKIQHIQDGKAGEPYAVGSLEDIYGITTVPVGFIRTDDLRFGASPDRVANVSADKTSVGIVVEAKCPTIPVQFQRLVFGDPDAYICQVQGQLWVAEADKAIFYSWHAQTPPYRVETGRNEAFIAKLADALNRFHDELSEWELRLRDMGAFQAFGELKAPLDAELAGQISTEIAAGKPFWEN
jgi:hypothetical protein